MQVKKKKTGNKGKYANTILVLSVILLSVTLAGMLVCMLAWKVRSSRKEPVYETFSMSEEAAARAYIWLNQIEDMPLSYTEIKQLMGDIHLTVVLMPTEEKGVFTRTLAEGTYTDCINRAQAGLEKAYREVVKYRFLAAGREEEFTDEILENLMQEAYGVSVSEYLLSCEVQLLPALEEVMQSYVQETAESIPGEAAYE